MTVSERLAALAAFYETLRPDSLDRLPDFYDHQARFIDPFNDVVGHAAIGRIFADLFERLDAPRFVVTGRYAGIGETPANEAVLRWEMRFESRRFGGGVHRFEGTTHLRFGPDGRVVLHRDDWDASALIARLPWIGAPLRLLRRRFASDQSTASA